MPVMRAMGIVRLLNAKDTKDAKGNHEETIIVGAVPDGDGRDEFTIYD
jgi:hypothetical protein